MERIDFHFNVPNRSIYACQLLKKVTGMGMRSAVWSTDAAFLQRVYADLWSFEALTFIPHAWASDRQHRDASPVVFGTDLRELSGRDVVVLLDEQAPAGLVESLKGFSRAVDIVSTQPQELANARSRYRAWKGSGITINAYDRGKK